MRKLLENKWMTRTLAVVFTALVIPMNTWAAGPPKKSELDNPLAVTLLIIIGALLLAIALLAHVLIGAAQLKYDRIKKEKAAAAAKATALLICCLFSTAVFAQADTTAAAPAAEVVSNTIGGLSKTSFYALVGVLAVELVIIVWMLVFLRSMIAKEQAIAAAAKGVVVKKNRLKDLWNRMNKFRSLSEEKDIDMGHAYDGIRELDNKLPPWWLYGFYISIIFSAIYLWRYHVSHSAPLSTEELAIAITKAEEENASRLKKAGSDIDENTVKLMTAATDIDAGKKIFTTSCAPCHAADGGGVVGPNLTDDYWLHGGSVKDIFKTIKYGVPEKGMQPWKGTFSPTQMAQLTGFIKSIKGAKVANAKEPQGDLYKEEQPTSDSTRIAAVN